MAQVVHPAMQPVRRVTNGIPRHTAVGSLLAPAVEAASPLSNEPQSKFEDVFEFEVQSPSDFVSVEVDVEDDLAAPLLPYTKEYIHENFREKRARFTLTHCEGSFELAVPPDVVEIDVKTYDVPAAFKRYGYKIEDSKPSPKRKALLVGIRGGSLKGPHNDVMDMKSLLIDVYGWKEEQIMLLIDEDPSSPLYPTRDCVLDHLFILIHNATSDDEYFLHFSGHGAQIEDTDGDEADGLDEVICCADGKIIVDDQLHDIIVKPLPLHCQLVAVFDCCASGTGLDLVKTPLGSRSTSANPSPGASPLLSVQELQFGATFASGALDLPHSLQADTNGETGGRKKYSEGDVVLWSACQDNADSHEVLTEEGRYKGAMSHAFVQCLRHNSQQTYQHLLDAIVKTFSAWKVPQKPQLTSSHKLDRNATFKI